MLTCLACVCVTEVQTDGGGEGTCGPQLVCHSLNLLPAAITADRRGHACRLIISLAPDCPDCGLFSRKHHVSSSIHLAQSCQLVPLALVSHVSSTSTPDKQLKSDRTVQKRHVYHKTSQFVPFTYVAVHLSNFNTCPSLSLNSPMVLNECIIAFQSAMPNLSSPLSCPLFVCRLLLCGSVEPAMCAFTLPG